MHFLIIIVFLLNLRELNLSKYLLLIFFCFNIRINYFRIRNNFMFFLYDLNISYWHLIFILNIYWTILNLHWDIIILHEWRFNLKILWALDNKRILNWSYNIQFLRLLIRLIILLMINNIFVRVCTLIN